MAQNIHRKIVRCTGHDVKVRDHFKECDKQVQNICYPPNIRVSSDKLKESIFTYRNAMRINQMNHQKYNPSLDSLSSKKLFKGLYNANEPEAEMDSMRNSVDEIVKNRTYMNNSVHLYEMYNQDSYQQKRAHREKLL